jgi:hypothetical protein
VADAPLSAPKVCFTAESRAARVSPPLLLPS